MSGAHVSGHKVSTPVDPNKMQQGTAKKARYLWKPAHALLDNPSAGESGEPVR